MKQPSKNREEMELRKEFEIFGKQVSSTNEPATWDEIADWWIDKLSQVCSQAIAEVREKIEGMKKISNNSVYVESDDGILVQVDSYNTALTDVLDLFPSQEDTI